MSSNSPCSTCSSQGPICCRRTRLSCARVWICPPPSSSRWRRCCWVVAGIIAMRLSRSSWHWLQVRRVPRIVLTLTVSRGIWTRRVGWRATDGEEEDNTICTAHNISEEEEEAFFRVLKCIGVHIASVKLLFGRAFILRSIEARRGVKYWNDAAEACRTEVLCDSFYVWINLLVPMILWIFLSPGFVEGNYISGAGQGGNIPTMEQRNVELVLGIAI